MRRTNNSRFALGGLVPALMMGLIGCQSPAGDNPVLQSASTSALSPSDERLASSAFQNALENSVSGKKVTWTNTQTGVSGSTTPVKTWKTTAGVYCRSYRENIVFPSGKSDNSTGTACRNQNGRWENA